MTNDSAPILMYPARTRERDNPYINTLGVGSGANRPADSEL